jgi:serine/threonine protein phosphatase PrpC
MEVHLSNYMKGALRFVSGTAYSQTKRGREVNEDSHLLETRELPSGSSVTLVGVFDGHGNEQLSHWLSLNFADVFFRLFSVFQQVYGLPDAMEYIRKMFPSDDSFRVRSKRLTALNCSDVVTFSLCASFSVCEEQAMSLANIDTAHGGSCATVAAITRAGFFVAKVGDCSAALISPSPPIGLILKTSDHRTCNRPDEVNRVLAQGGSVYKGNAVGMAYSSLNVTRSLGDTLWRANEDWRRDMTRDAVSNLFAIDESLSLFSREKGCVGVSSEPEWYSCCCVGGTSQGEQVLHWAVSSNSPAESISSCSSKVFFSDGHAVKFFLILGSDGFWETQAFASIMQKLHHEQTAFFDFSPQDLSQTAQHIIGSAPHDDSTLVVVELRIDKNELQEEPLQEEASQRRRVGSSDGEALFAKRPAVTVKRRTTSASADPNGPLDYLFK